jgi:hypothetical protein
MENQSNKPAEATGKVISFASRIAKAEQAKAERQNTTPSAASEPAFDDTMQKNMENAERIRKERLKANQGVLKSYRIKN